MTGLRGHGRWRGQASFRDVVAYVTKQSEDGPPLAQWCAGVASIETAGFEMEAVASQSRSADAVYHLILPWGPDERPGIGQARYALEMVLDELGFAGLQYVAALANDGESGLWHLHAVVNRVDPTTLRCRPVPLGDWDRIRAMCREAEEQDGWRIVDEALSTVFTMAVDVGRSVSEEMEPKSKDRGNSEEQDAVKAEGGNETNTEFDTQVKSENNSRENQQEAGQKAGQTKAGSKRRVGTNARDRYGMSERYKAFLSDEVKPRLDAIVASAAGTWAAWTEVLASFDFRYEVVRDGARDLGARIMGGVSGWSMRISDLGFDHGDLVSRFGAWLGRVVDDRFGRRVDLDDAVDECRAAVADLDEDAGWAGVHAEFARRGLGIERVRGGSRIIDLDGPGWERIDRADGVLSMRVLEERFGPYEASGASETREAAREAVRQAEALAAGARLRSDPTPVLETLFHTRSTVSEAEVRKEVERRVADADQRESVMTAVIERLIAIDIGGELHLSTPEVRDEERAGRGAASMLATTRMPFVVSRASSDALDAQQAEAYGYVVRPDSRLKVVTGVPGSGKTTLLNELDEAFRDAGYRTRAVAVSNAAVEVLRRETGLSARSVAKELAAWRRERAGSRGHAPRAPLGVNDVLFVDEVSTLGTEYGRALFAEAAEAGSVVVVLGDDKQFQAVARGDALRIAQEAVGDRRIDMMRTRRQAEGWMRTATEAVRAGNIRGALTMYRDHGHVHEFATDAEARSGLISRWTALEESGTTTSIETYTNGERVRFNALARTAYRAMGRLEGPDHELEVMDGKMPFAIGDRVVVRDTIAGTGLINGSTGVVRGIRGRVIDFEKSGGGVVTFDTREHAAVQHNYSSTEYREQGATRSAELQYITRHVHQRSLTVGMTRHTQEYGAYYSRSEIWGGFEGLVRLGERSERKALVLDGRELGRAADIIGERGVGVSAGDRGVTVS